MRNRPIVCFVLFVLTILLPAAARAECGGDTECIAVSINPSVAPAHGTPLVSGPLAFGNQAVATSSAGRAILVGHVTGKLGSLSTLGAIILSGDTDDFRIVGNTCVIGEPSLPRNAPGCTITVAFNPATLGPKSATIAVSTSRITRRVPLIGTGTAVAPAAEPTTLSVERNRPSSVDLFPLISGTNLLGVRILGAPSNGTAMLNGTVLTYTPSLDYVGTDSLTYESFSATQSSGPTTVTVSVVPREDPSKNAAVVGLVSAQTQAVRRFSRAQISNFQDRMRSLHRRRETTTAGGASGMAAGDSGPAQASGGAGGGSDAVMRALAGPLTTLVSSGALDLGSASGGVLPEMGARYGLWVGGNVRFGSRGQTSNSERLRFSTDGISVGVDRRISNNLALGLGLGFARDETDVGFDGTNSESTAWSVIGYGSYQPTADVFVDTLIGYGVTSLDTHRFVPSSGTFANAERDGDQLFASLAAGYEFRMHGALVSPFLRFDYAHDRLDRATETGAGTASLTYLQQSFPTFQLAMGLRAESAHRTRFGWVEPRAFVEYRHDFEDGRPANLVYADQPSGPVFSVAPSAIERDTMHVGLGTDIVFRQGMRLGVDYEIQLLSSLESSQTLRFRLLKEFGGVRATPPPTAPSLFENPVTVKARYTWDDNLNRTRTADKLYDHIYSLNVGQQMIFPLTTNSRLVARWFIDAVKLHTYSGLDHLSGGVQAMVRYRPSRALGAPTFGLFARAVLDGYDSGARDGYRYSVGVDLRTPLTDRINLFAALTHNARNANAQVFDGHHIAGQLRLNYSLRRAGTLYASGEFREGDSVSSASAPLTANSMADDAYDGRTLFASRYDARTALMTFGYSLPLGKRDSLDFSWTRAHAEPTGGQSFLAAGPYGGAGGSRSYTVNRYSIFYLLRF